MIHGNQDCVAIEISIEQTIEPWVYGRLLLWLGGGSVGNHEDCGVDIEGCINWLSDFLMLPRDRCVPDLMLAPKDIVWRELVEPVFESVEADARYSDPFSRFHLSHLGMSAFDRVTLLLINDGKKNERYLWQQNKEVIMDYTAPLGSLEASAKEAILWFQKSRWHLPV
jgi:hypothetical protein